MTAAVYREDNGDRLAVCGRRPDDSGAVTFDGRAAARRLELVVRGPAATRPARPT